MKIINPREILLPYIGHFIDAEKRYQFNGVNLEGNTVSLFIHDMIAECDSDAQIAWLVDGLDAAFIFLENVGFTDENFEWEFEFPLSGKLS